MKISFFIVIFFIAGGLWAADSKQVMPAKQRAQIVATAKALFEPQVKNTLRIGKVNSPFAAAAGE